MGMRSISEYLMQAPNVYQTRFDEYLLGKNRTMTAKFPKTPKTDDIINFLEEEGFEEYELGYSPLTTHPNLFSTL